MSTDDKYMCDVYDFKSRAHSIVELVFKQTFKNEKGNLMQRQSAINLIDLAGSERADKAMTSGERLKEGISINLSLTCLGNCIAALAAQNGTSTRIPYRDSILTKMLMNVLGGNSRTLMVKYKYDKEDREDYNYSLVFSILIGKPFIISVIKCE